MSDLQRLDDCADDSKPTKVPEEPVTGFYEDRILIVDVETSGLDPAKDDVVEIGCVLWDIEHCTIVEVMSGLTGGTNAAAEINGIPESLLATVCDDEAVWRAAGRLAEKADCFLAHNASFDRAFAAAMLDPRLEDGQPATPTPWICSMDDVTWPLPAPSRSLTAIALAHGVPVVSAHRALTDCLTLARLLENCAMRGVDVRAMLEEGLRRALLPRYRFVSLEPYARKDEVKAAGFRWDDAKREWWRTMSEEDAAKVEGVRMRKGEVQG